MSLFKSKTIRDTSKPLSEPAKRLVILFPELDWDLKKAGYNLDKTQFLSMVLYLTIMIFVACILFVIAPLYISQGSEKLYVAALITLIVTFLGFLYFLFMPRMEIARRSHMIDKDLEYMLKDMGIQLSSGVPLFDTLVNVGGGRYGECSVIADGIVQEVESGRSMTEVLDDVGLWSPSEYLRNVLWQIVNAIRSGADIRGALEAISNDLRLEKENRIRAYAQELNLYGLIYMMAAVVMPSMGVTLITILSSFMGQGFINESLYWAILAALILFQLAFITFVKSKRPDI